MRERKRACVCVFVRECACVCERERKSECMYVRESVCVCVRTLYVGVHEMVVAIVLYMVIYPIALSGQHCDYSVTRSY